VRPPQRRSLGTRRRRRPLEHREQLPLVGGDQILAQHGRDHRGVPLEVARLPCANPAAEPDEGADQEEGGGDREDGQDETLVQGPPQRGSGGGGHPGLACESRATLIRINPFTIASMIWTPRDPRVVVRSRTALIFAPRDSR
jgi:hypothetical protein